MKPKKRSFYIKKLDDIAKGFAKQRDKYICQKSGEYVEGSNAHGSHVVPVSAGQQLRWDLVNIKCLSYHNHINWWHKNPTESGKWFAEKFPERMKHIDSRRYSSYKIPLINLVEFYEKAKNMTDYYDYIELYEDMIGKHI